MIGVAKDGVAISITGLGCKVPDRVVTNEELAQKPVQSLAKLLDRVHVGLRVRKFVEWNPSHSRQLRQLLSSVEFTRRTISFLGVAGSAQHCS